MFSCFPDDDKCEWRKLKGFIEKFNSVHETDFMLSQCLDMDGLTGPQPEFLVKNTQGKKLVVEHKIVVYPSDFLKRHRSHHNFRYYLLSHVSHAFQDDVYIFTINESEIELSKTELKKIAENIGNILLKNQDMIKKSCGVQSSKPINWTFMRQTDYKRDNYTSCKGVTIETICRDPLSEEFFREKEEAPAEIKKQLNKHIEKTCIKFDGYSDCLRIFVTELYGESFCFSHEILLELIASMEIPKCIDQIWIGYPEWVSEDDYVTDYQLVYPCREVTNRQ